MIERELHLLESNSRSLHIGFDCVPLISISISYWQTSLSMKESPELNVHVTYVEVKKASSLVFEEEDANVSLPNSLNVQNVCKTPLNV